MYVSSGNPSGAIPNNSVVIGRRYSSAHCIDIYFITNSSAYMNSSFITQARSYYNGVYFQNSYRPGVARFYSNDLCPNNGVYTAHVTDVNDITLELNVGIYNYRFSGKLIVASYQRLSLE